MTIRSAAAAVAPVGPATAALYERKAARKAVVDYGVRINDVDLEAFKRVSAPLLKDYLRKPELDSLYRRIRDLA